MENKIIQRSYDPSLMWIFDEGLPIGNGRLGAMVPHPNAFYGEKIWLNEDSLWHGPHAERDNSEAFEHLDEIRRLLRDRKYEEADKLCYGAMTSSPKYFGSYSTMGCVYLQFNHGDTIENYERVLDIEKGIASMKYTQRGVNIFRENFVSAPDNVMVFKISSDKPVLDIHSCLMRRPVGVPTDVIDGSIIHMPGQCGPGGISFDSFMSAKTDGELSIIGDFIYVKNASEIALYVTAATDFYESDPYNKALSQLKKAMEYDYETLKNRHIEDFSSLFNRSFIDFGTNNEVPIDERLSDVRDGKDDNGLIELFFNYGKYLTISGSRPGTQAMNLQGIWNNKQEAAWESNYTLNINTQMNYWPSEVSGLSECHEPLMDLLERMLPNGEKTARIMYHCDGFVGHHTSNIWGDTAIEGCAFPSAIWLMGGAWLCLHAWDHFMFTQDKEFLRERAFPIMKKSAIFFTQYLIKGEDGCYITSPSISPESSFYTEDGQIGKECEAPEMDNQILRALFRSVIKAYEILGENDEYYEIFKLYLSKIRKTKTTKDGRIMEWDKDYVERDPHHHHLSHLFGLYPDYQITPSETPELAEACKKTLERRAIDSETGKVIGFYGWNGAWRSACYSRLGCGNEALDALYTMLRTPGAITNTFLSRYPVFQIEGSFGAAAAVAEMLLRSDDERIFLLPALPDKIKDGSFSGLCARGGFILSAEWKNGKLTKATVTSKAGNRCKIKADGLILADADFSAVGDFIEFDTEAGKTYTLAIRGSGE